MIKIDYPFKCYKDGKIRPFIPIRIINPNNGKQINIDAIIDTGADNCAFPKIVADHTNHDLKGLRVESSVSNGISGTDVNTWKHSFLVQLLDPTGRKVLKTSKVLLIDCFDHNDCPPLLGGNDFLIDLSVTFNYVKKIITITWE